MVCTHVYIYSVCVYKITCVGMYMYIGGITVCTLGWHGYCIWPHFTLHVCGLCICVYKGGSGSTDKVFVCPLSHICLLCVCRILGLGRRKDSLASLWRQWIL